MLVDQDRDKLIESIVPWRRLLPGILLILPTILFLAVELHQLLLSR